MKPNLSLIGILILFNACKSTTQSFPSTIRIDTSVYQSLQKRFHLRFVTEAHDYLGGLHPNYPIAIAGVDCFDTPRDTDWRSGGMWCGELRILIKKRDDYVIINNKKELKATFAPITTSQAALSYAILSTRFIAIFDNDFFKSRYKYYDGKPEISFVKKQGSDYIVHLFRYQKFGCEHPYFSGMFKVTHDGDVTPINVSKSFEDPKDNGLCVD